MAVEPKPHDHRGWRWPTLARIAGVKPYEQREVYQIEKHVLERLAHLPQAPDQTQRLKDWVASRLTYPLLALLKQAKGNGKFFFGLNTVVVGGGFTTSSIALAAGTHKSQAIPWVIFGFGLAVALAGGITQVFRPGHRSSERWTLVMKLREDGWAFANSTGMYAVDVAKAFLIFDARLTEIHRQAIHVALIDGDDATVAAAKAASAAVLKTFKDMGDDDGAAAKKTTAAKKATVKKTAAKKAAAPRS